MDLLSIKRKLLPLSGPQDMGGGGGGGSGGTTVQELPEWARPYAKSALEKGAALSEKPYQAYDAPRISGFSPMQLQAQQGAANMQTSGLTGLGGQVAGEAAMRGLGQDYQAGRFAGGRFTPGAAGAYMSPFIEQALQPQLREAQRSSDIMGQQNAAKAVGQGAFGGSRSALVEAERQRNLGTQMGDIRAKGLQDAYSAATSQFNADQQRALQAQQMGEQSRQFGANLGLQGLQTALTGAGQLGALGGQQFQQGMDINKLQSAYGGQQQALRQQGMDLAYQDFLNEQNYPYKQLGFMSDMIRGLPLGQVSTQQMYAAPGSTAGQIAGLGIGALGLSKFMADGGLAYAKGGVTEALNDPAALTSEMDKLSDEQLQQILQHPTTKAQFEAAQEEMAMRASERGGMAGAFNQLPQDTQQQMVTAANGGIVAFADGSKGTVGEDAAREQLKSDREALLGGLESIGRAGADVVSAPVRGVAGAINSALIRPARAVSGYEIPYIFGDSPEMTESLTPFYDKMRAREDAGSKAKDNTATPDAGDKFDRSTATRRTDYTDKTSGTGTTPASPAGSITAAAKQMAASAGVPEEDFLTTFRKLRTELQAEGKEDMKALNDQITKMSGRSKEIKEQGLGKALAEFGFLMAAEAAKPQKPGENKRGLMGLLGSAAAASPALAASAAKTDELARAAEDNALKMQLTMKQYEIAQRKGDTQAAAQMAQNMRMLQQTEKQLELKRAEIAQSGGYQQGMLDIHRQDLARKEKADEVRGLQAAAQQRGAEARFADVRRKAALDFDTSNGRILRKQLEEQYGPVKGEYMYNQKKQSYIGDILQTARDQRAESNTGVQSVYDLLSRE